MIESLDEMIPVKKLYFELGNFIWPKISVNAVEFNKSEVIKKLRFSARSKEMLVKMNKMLTESNNINFESISSTSFQDGDDDTYADIG